jgi:hypothetical protein
MKTLFIPSNIEKIEELAFAFNYDLERVVMTSQNITIEEYAFYKWLKLKDVYFIGRNMRIESISFEKCDNLEKIKVTEEYSNENKMNGIEINKELLITGKCGELCEYLIDKETKQMIIYGNGNIESFETIDNEIGIKEIIIEEEIERINKLPQISTLEIIEYNGIQEIECTITPSSDRIIGIKTIEEYPKSTICGIIVSRKYESINYNIKWMITDENKLIIYGKGEIPNYTKDELPEWNKYKDQIITIEIKEGITEIGDNSMKGLTKVTEITIS